jgi:hypothetical protein
MVVFLVWQSLAYSLRLLLSFSLVVAGIVVQLVTESFLSGVIPLVLGNALLLVRGYDNRVDIKGFSPDADWEKAELHSLEEILELDKSIRKWDTSIIDVTNWLGALFFLAVAAALGALAWLLDGLGRIIVLDAMVLLLPHWFTGVRRILRFPKLIVRAEALSKVLESTSVMIGKDDSVELMMLLKGKEVRIPEDVKFRVTLAGQDPDFLGLYGQVVINDVQGRSYPYFYVVMVARKGYGLERFFDEFQPPGNITKELDSEGEVEFVVVRQTTTRKSGYHTKPADAIALFAEGYSLARSASATAD